MDDLYIICGGCKNFIRRDGSCKKQFVLFHEGKIPAPVSGKVTKKEVQACWEP
jgi:hypothetical protein